MVMRRTEDGSGLVELLVAAALGLLGLGVVAAVARGPVAAATAAARPQDRIEGLLLLRDVVGGQVRAARGDGTEPPVLAAGPDHVVLATARDDGVGWSRLSIADGSLLLDAGSGVAPEGPAATGRRLVSVAQASFAVLDAVGAELSGPVAGALRSGDPRRDDAAVLELRVEVDGRRHDLAVALRAGP